MIRKVAKEMLKNQYVFDLGVMNLNGGVEVFKVKLESKGNDLSLALSVKNADSLKKII